MSEKTSPPTVSVVVLSYNRPEYTNKALQALTSLPSGVDFELIVVDNGSDERTVRMLCEWKILKGIDKLLLLPENLGTSPGFNRGFLISDPRSRFLTKLDNDIEILTPYWLAEILAVFEEINTAGIVATDILNHHGLKKLQAITLSSGRKVKDWAGWRAGGGGMTFRRESYDRFGGFKEDFPADLKLMPDDYEYYHRLKRAGLDSYYICTAHSRMLTECNKEYEIYNAPKDRQYHLLRTRFFKICSGVEENFLPYISQAILSFCTIEGERYLLVDVRVICSKPCQVGLGMTLTHTNSRRHLYDEKNDIMMQLYTDYVECKRRFRLPENAEKGYYDVTVNLTEGKPGRSSTIDRYALSPSILID